MDSPPSKAGGYTWSEEYRHACEVRYVQRMSPFRRAEYLEGVAAKRGKGGAGAAAAARIREGVKVLDQELRAIKQQ